MVKKKSTAQSTKAGRYAIGRAGFAKISAVEGIYLTEAMRKRADDKKSKGLTAEEHRSIIISKYRNKG
jgi:hypothetical protein